MLQQSSCNITEIHTMQSTKQVRNIVTEYMLREVTHMFYPTALIRQRNNINNKTVTVIVPNYYTDKVTNKTRNPTVAEVNQTLVGLADVLSKHGYSSSPNRSNDGLLIQVNA